MWLDSFTEETPDIPCHYVNLRVVPGSKLNPEGDFRATILLENPEGENLLTYQQLQLEVGN